MRLFLANAEYVPRMEQCARMCCAEHGEATMGGPLNWECYRDFWIGLLTAGTGVLFGYENDEGEPVAGFGGCRFKDPHTGLWRATQVFVYCQPAYRGRIFFRKPMRMFEQWAAESGCAAVVMPLLPSMPILTRQLYERMGYVEQQVNYLKLLKGQNES